MATYHFPTDLRRFLLKIVGAGFFFLVLKATFKLQRILQQFLLTVVTPNLRGCYSDGDIVVEDLATSSLVSSSFIGYEVDLGGKKAIADMSASSSVVHASSPTLGAMYPHQTIQTNRPIEQRLIFRGCVFKTVTPNSSVQRLTRSQRYTEHCKTVVYQPYMLQDEKPQI